MGSRSNDQGKPQRRIDTNTTAIPESKWVFGVVVAILGLASFFVGTAWAGFHGVLLAFVGLLMLFRPPGISLPRSWWMLAAVFVAGGLTAFLPGSWFPSTDWRRKLESLGVDTGTLWVIQPRMAAEALAILSLMLLIGLWLAGHRASATILRRWSLAFVLGVATYALVSKVAFDAASADSSHQGQLQFGFFPNRNHTATYLAMGSICGFGCALQAMRDKRFAWMAASIATTSICLWAITCWSLSRGGVVLVAIGLLIWLPMLGRKYLGKHGIWAVALVLLAGGGIFLLMDNPVRQRLEQTVSLADSVLATRAEEPTLGKSGNDSVQGLDFRIPTFLDTLEMIGTHPWSGVGAAQYYYLFPQYRKRTIIAQDADSYHPESDWLWIAAELGLPSALALLVLVALAFRKSIRQILGGRERALRSACLVAALLVPIHGLFDVPGHRITLALSSAFLFALSVPATLGFGEKRIRRRWPFRLLSLPCLLASAWLIYSQWLGGPTPATTAASEALRHAQRLYAEDLELQKAATQKGLPYQPSPEEDKLEMALESMRKASLVAPLDRDLPRFQAYLSLQFDDKYNEVDNLFAVNRLLDPTWVAEPYQQAQALALIAPAKSAELCREALRRAAMIDLRDQSNHWSSKATFNRIRQTAKGKPGMELFLKDSH